MMPALIYTALDEVDGNNLSQMV